MIIKNIEYFISDDIEKVEYKLNMLIKYENLKGYKIDEKYYFEADTYLIKVRPIIICSLHKRNDGTVLNIDIILDFTNILVNLVFLLIFVFFSILIIRTWSERSFLLNLQLYCLIIIFGFGNLIIYIYHSKKLLNNFRKYVNEYYK